MPKPHVLFQYPNSSHAELPNDINLTEDKILEKLTPLFDPKLHIRIQQIILERSILKSQFVCKISVVSDDIDFNLEEESNDYSTLIHDSMNKLINYVRQENQKRTEH